MIVIVALLLRVLTAVCAICTCFAEVVNFDRGAAGSLPPGWTVSMTHAGGSPRWEVIVDDTSTDRTAGRFPLAIWNGATLRDGTVSVKFKAISGTVDQGAGLVWRYQDPNNYYIVRANALEDNVVLYKVQHGERVALAPKGAVSNAYGVKHRVPKQTWTALSVGVRGTVFTVSLDGETLFSVEDSTFTGAGKTGLWTKSDSVIYFDDFQIEQERQR
jgi:hypothetical protein